MKTKILLKGFVLVSCSFIWWQQQIKQTVSAETKDLISSQSETIQEVITASTVISTGREEVIASITSSIKEIESNEQEKKKTNDLIAGSTESEKTTGKPTTSTSIVSEGVSEIQTPLQIEKAEKNYQFSVSKNQTTEAFIELIGKEAQQIAWDEELYASVMLAQAILETGSGNSQLARPPYHNLFGIKGSYQGKQVSFKTQEDKGNGELYTIQSAFRQYPSYKESLEDYAALLKSGLSGNVGFYQGTWKSNAGSYQEAAKALTGKYATDTAYDKKLVALIEAYNLTFYDQDPAVSVEAEQNQSVNDQIKLEDNSEEKKSVEVSNETIEQPIIVNETTQSVVVIPTTAQRPAKQLSGNQLVQ
ncbi:glucosaminidase domain-containing protein [Candidatus Enterococcus ferrettii]|uniref:Mannosyl-glycoprotein endo-beta-N-acetylglucosamidase-like domain-containing protein n=1 Tax=Candidatus Enterococcus ferrettii TaxID=2815324 RepID=A0ABV0ELX0_9ENTE|nr:glucosaminidase domain-containing protein [Enterococcus sp. 665A]MBO1341236.1 glucosaminidase domain-containing protein [Enterococcus sp. 665A]